MNDEYRRYAESRSREGQKTFRESEATGDRTYQKTRGIAEEVFTEITVHSTLEEELFYPAVKESRRTEMARTLWLNLWRNTVW